MDIKGKLIEIFDTTRVSDKFQKREFAVEYAENPSYPEYIKFELIQDKCGLLDQFHVGQEVQVHFNRKGRKWTDPQGNVKYFNSLHAWKIAPSDTSEQTNAPTSPTDSNVEQLIPVWLSVQNT